MGPGQAGTLFLPPSTIHFMTCERNNMTADNRDFDVFEISRKVIENGDYPKVQIVQKDGNWFTLNNLQLEVCRRLESDGLCTQVKADIIPISEIPDELCKMMVLPQKQPVLSSNSSSTPKSSSPKIKTPSSTCTNEKTTVECEAKVKNDTASELQSRSSCLPLSPRPCSRGTEDDTSRATGRGYQKLCQKEKTDRPTTKETDEDDSQCSDSEDSECDDECDSDCDWSDDDDDDQDNSSDYDSSGEDHESTDDERECLL